MANWFCSVFNVVCVVNVCPLHVVDLNYLTLRLCCHRPWTMLWYIMFVDVIEILKNGYLRWKYNDTKYLAFFIPNS